jgi:glutathione S-transferase
MALEERGIPYQYREVNPYKKEKHFLGWFLMFPS